MIERYPAYYENFRCIADRCEDTCCAGWEIDIDDASYDAYMKVDGELGEKLRTLIKTYEHNSDDNDTEDDVSVSFSVSEDELYEKHGFRLTADMRCPFLDDDNLCVLYRELGEESLCEVCTNTPRNFLEYCGAREISISASCPEAARLIYGSSGKMEFIERETDEEFELEEDEDELELGAFLKKVRDDAIDIMQDRDKDLNERIILFMIHSERVQDAINDWEAGAGDLTVPEIPNCVKAKASEAYQGIYQHFLIRMGTYTGLASIGKPWADRIGLVYDLFVNEEDDGRERYEEAVGKLKELIKNQNRTYEYEHLIIYYIFLLLNRSIDDYDYLGKAKLTVLSFLMNVDMDAAVFMKNGEFTTRDREENARLYAREVEHAEENMADIAEEILFERAYDTESLIELLS